MQSAASGGEGAREPFLRSANGVFALSFLSLSVVWLVWWIGLYPGILSQDSLDQWAQALKFKFNNWHPYLYTLIMSGLSHLVRSPSLMGLLQIVLTAFVVSAIVRYAYVRGVKGSWVIVAVAVYALHPQFGSLSVTIWKDVLFSALLLAEAFLLYLIVSNAKDPAAEQAWWPYVVIGLIAGASATIRVNGAVNLVLPAVLLLISAASRKRIAVLAATGLVTYAFFGVVLFNAINVQPAFLQVDQLKLKMVGAIYRLSDPSKRLSAQERAVFEDMMPASVWRDAYTPRWSNDLYFKHFLLLPQVEQLTPQNISESRFYAEWTQAAYGAALHNPDVVLEDKVLQVGHFLGSYYHGASYLTDFKPNIGVLRQQGYPDVASVTPSTRFVGLRAFLLDVLKMSSANWLLGGLLWAVGWVVVADIAMLVYAARKRLKASVIFISFVLLNVVFVMAIAPASDYRYLYFAYLAVFVTPLLLAAELRDADIG